MKNDKLLCYKVKWIKGKNFILTDIQWDELYSRVIFKKGDNVRENKLMFNSVEKIADTIKMSFFTDSPGKTSRGTCSSHYWWIWSRLRHRRQSHGGPQITLPSVWGLISVIGFGSKYFLHPLEQRLLSTSERWSSGPPDEHWGSRPSRSHGWALGGQNHESCESATSLKNEATYYWNYHGLLLHDLYIPGKPEHFRKS